MEKNKALVGDILVEFCMIESCIGSIFYDNIGKAPAWNDKIYKKFYEYLDSRVNAVRKSTDKIYESKDGKKISLIELLGEIKRIRDIAAHQTWELIGELSIVPEEARGRLLGSYRGGTEDLHNEWTFYSRQFEQIFRVWNESGLEIFDIDGTQIAEQ